MQDFYRIEDEYIPRAQAMADKACTRFVKDMHYESRVQAVITYHAQFRMKKLTKAEARIEKLTREQYLQVRCKLFVFATSLASSLADTYLITFRSFRGGAPMTPAVGSS